MILDTNPIRHIDPVESIYTVLEAIDHNWPDTDYHTAASYIAVSLADIGEIAYRFPELPAHEKPKPVGHEPRIVSSATVKEIIRESLKQCMEKLGPGIPLSEICRTLIDPEVTKEAVQRRIGAPSAYKQYVNDLKRLQS